MKIHLLGKLFTTIWLAIFLFSSHSTSAQTEKEPDRTLKASIKIIEKDKNGSCRSDFAGQVIDKEGGYYIVKTTLYGGNNYFIIGAGDKNIADLDIILLNKEKIVIKQDADNKLGALIELNPHRTGVFYVAVLSYKGKGFSKIIICHR